VKRVIPYILVVMLIITACISFGGVALADESITTSVKVNPSSLPGAGTTSVTVTVKNNGDPINNVRLKYPSPTDTVITLGDMETGATKEHANGEWNITEDMLDQDLAFSVIWTSLDGSEKSGKTQSIKISKKAETVDISGSASASATEVNKGDKVKFKFTMENKGTVKVDNAYLNAPPIENGNQIGSNFSLDPGATKNMEYTITVNESMEVKPVFTYAVNGQQQTLNLNTMNIKVNASETVTMGVTLQADKTKTTQGNDVNFTVTVTNTGTSQLDGLSVKDFDGNIVNMSSNSLQAGASSTGTVTLPISETGNYAFTASAVGAGGQSVNMQSNSIAITLDGDATPSPDASASAGPLDASKIIRTDISLSSTKLKEPGEVKIEVTVKNLTEDVLKNVVVMDSLIGTIGTSASLDAGESTVFEKSFMAEETADYEFVTTAEMPDGQSVESKVGTTIAVEAKDSGGLETWQLGLIIVLIAIGAVAGVLAYYLYRQKKRGSRGKPARPRPQPYERPSSRPSSSSGRERPQRYQPRPGPDYDMPPEHTTAAQQQQYQRKRAMRIETLEPKGQPSRHTSPENTRPSSSAGRITPTPRPAGKAPSRNDGPATKFGDRNKF